MWEYFLAHAVNQRKPGDQEQWTQEAERSVGIQKCGKTITLLHYVAAGAEITQHHGTSHQVMSNVPRMKPLIPKTIAALQNPLPYLLRESIKAMRESGVSGSCN